MNSKYLYVLLPIIIALVVFVIYYFVISKEPDIQQGYIPFEKPYSIQPVFSEEKADDINYQLYKPGNMTTDDNGNVYIMDGGNSRIVKFNSKGEYVTSWGQLGAAPKDFGFNDMDAGKICYKNGKVYVYDKYLDRVQIFDTEGNYIEGFNLESIKPFYGLLVDLKGNIYIAHALDLETDSTIDVYSRAGAVYKYKKSIAPLPFAISSDGLNKLSLDQLALVHFFTLSFIQQDEKENIYLVFYTYPLIRKYSTDGKLIWSRTYFDISESLPHSASPISVRYRTFPKPEDVKLDWLLDKNNLHKFSVVFSVDIINKRLLIDGYPHGQIYVLNYDGDILGAYYPFDILKKDPDYLAEHFTYSDEIKPAWKLCYDSVTGRGYFTHIFDALFYMGTLDH
ncbi:MAG: hypothetical protein JW737_05750 [Acidobacteria bacterium]|nr:hypothetical protein [Acidobacteriota bacterium]